VPDEIEGQGEERAQDGRRERGEEDGHGRDEDELEVDIGDGDEERALDPERVGVDDGQEDQRHGQGHDEERQGEAEELAEDELGPVEGLGQQGEDRLLVDLLVDEPVPMRMAMRTPNSEMDARPTSLMILIRSPTVRMARTRERRCRGREEEEEVEDAVALGSLKVIPAMAPIFMSVSPSRRRCPRASRPGLRERRRPFRPRTRSRSSSTLASSKMRRRTGRPGPRRSRRGP